MLSGGEFTEPAVAGTDMLQFVGKARFELFEKVHPRQLNTKMEREGKFFPDATDNVRAPVYCNPMGEEGLYATAPLFRIRNKFDALSIEVYVSSILK